MISISRNGAEIGEWTEDQIRSFYQEGRLIASDLYWQVGMSEWASLENLVKGPTPSRTSSPPPLPNQSLPRIQDSAGTKLKGTHDWKKESLGCAQQLMQLVIIGFVLMVFRIKDHNVFYLGCIGAVIGLLLGLIPYLILLRTARKHHFYILYIAVIGGFIAAGEMEPAIYALGVRNELIALSAEHNKSVPKKIDNELEEDSSSVEDDGSICYRFTYTGNPGDIVETTAQNDNLKAGYIEAYRTSPDFSIFRDNHVTIHYDYYDPHGSLITRISVGSNDLK